MFRNNYPGKRASLDNVCLELNVDNNERIRNGHGVLLDAKQAQECYRKMVDGNAQI